MKNLFFLAIIGTLLIGCNSLHSSVDESKKSKDLITIKIVQINDVYEIEPLGGGEFGGLARVGHVRDSIKQLFPNTYLFLAGDFLNPSLLGTVKVDGERLNGKQMIEALNALEIDLVTFGNHEFDLKEEDLQKRLNESQFEWTSANVRQVTKNGRVPFMTNSGVNKVQSSDYSILTAKGAAGNEIKFGVFGVTLPSNPKDYVYYGDIYDDAVRAYNLASKESDFVIGLTHVALEEDMEIARRIKSLPLIMGGHEHYNMLEKEGSVVIAKADANAKSVYVHTLTYNTSTEYLHLDSELVMITDKVASSPKVEQVVSKWTKILDQKLKETLDEPDSVIFYASDPLDGTDGASRGMQTNLGEIITKSMASAYAGQVEGALVNGGSIRIDDMLEGDLTGKDIFRILPFGGSVLKVDIKGELLVEVLDFGKEKRGTGAYLQRYNFSQNSDGKWRIGNQLISNDKSYSVALSDFLLRGLDIPFLTPENKGVLKIYTPEETETAGDIRRAIISYLNSLEK